MTKKGGGASLTVMESYTNGLANRIIVGTIATRLTTQNVKSFTCIVQASHDNTGRVLVGNQQNQVFELDAGEAISVPWSAMDTYVRAESGTQTVNWLAGG